jgi:AcrR family transcriptional regulator
LSGKDIRQGLLDRAVQYVAENGIGDVSLRQLAAALGTSHRMLIHHFGSKQGLWIEIVRTVEERQRDVLTDIIPDPARPSKEAMRAWWKHISDPALGFRLKFAFIVGGPGVDWTGAARVKPTCARA